MEVIVEADELYRRIAPDHVKPDGSIASVAFKLRGQPDNSISVDLARLTTPEETARRAGRPGFQVARFAAGVPMSMGFTVRHDPIDGNPAHSLVEGQNDKQKCSRLAAASQLVPLQLEAPP